jgi:hypothetical protein
MYPEVDTGRNYPTMPTRILFAVVYGAAANYCIAAWLSFVVDEDNRWI